MNQEQTTQQALAYLERFTVDDNQYIIGIYQKGITIHNQQIRALNIFHCLHHLEKINKDTHVGIIGGGISGLTFAAAALHSRIKVSLFEKEGILLPLQSGCKTRFIHPNIYGWPSDGSLSKETTLPILNWEAASADVVAKKIDNEFKEIRNFYEQRGLNFDNYYNQTLNSGTISEIVKNEDGKWTVSTDKGGLMVCDVLIYAVGFGVEKSELENTMSYWRCTDISQEPEQSAEYLISGVGDGAFMDLITALIRDFDYDKVTALIAENALLITNLQESRTEFFRLLKIEKEGGVEVPKDFMFKEFEGLKLRFYQHILPKLNIREFRIVLHSRKKIEHIFNIDKVSMLNAFLVFLLKDKFIYHGGEYKYDKEQRYFALNDGTYKHEGDRIFFRHGTKRDELIGEIPGLSERIEKKNLKIRQEGSIHDGDIQQLWLGEDFNKRFEEAHYREILGVTGNALSCLETFARGIAGQLVALTGGKLNFRLTLHKVVSIRDKMYYQQVTPYYGYPRIHGDGGFGRIFSWNIGSVGYSILKGKPLLILKDGNVEEYKQILEQLILTGKHEDLVDSHKKCFLSIPFLAHVPEEESITNFVLYMDSEDSNFFTEPVFDAILTACKNFSESFESLVAKGQLTRGVDSKPYRHLNEDDKKLFSTVHKFGKLLGDSSSAYKEFKDKLKKGQIPEFAAFNSLVLND